MKKLSLLFVLICASMFTIFAQENWFELNSGTTQSLKAVHFTDNNTGFVCGYNGTILKTTDAGETWESKVSGTNVELNSIHFPNNDIGYIVGNEGHILKTIDAGENWEVIVSEININIVSSHFISINTGFAVSANGQIIKTNDGAYNWETIFTNSSYHFSSITFTNQNVGYVVGSNTAANTGVIFKTTDSGDNWLLVHNDSEGVFYDVFFVNEDVGYVAGSCPTVADCRLSIKTDDGGNTWFNPFDSSLDYNQFPPPTHICAICISSSIGNSLYYISEDIGYIVGGYTMSFSNSPAICMTYNGGSYWYTGEIPHFLQDMHMFDIFFTDENTGYSVGGQGIILKTTNAGGIETNIETSISKTNTGELFQIFPNPAIENAVITYEINFSGFVDISVFDINGKMVKSIVTSNDHKSGNFEINLNTQNLENGVYFCIMTTKANKLVKKLIVI